MHWLHKTENPKWEVSGIYDHLVVTKQKTFIAKLLLLGNIIHLPRFSWVTLTSLQWITNAISPQGTWKVILTYYLEIVNSLELMDLSYTGKP